jgi:hypothetical protein
MILWPTSRRRISAPLNRVSRTDPALCSVGVLPLAGSPPALFAPIPDSAAGLSLFAEGAESPPASMLDGFPALQPQQATAREIAQNIRSIATPTDADSNNPQLCDRQSSTS